MLFYRLTYGIALLVVFGCLSAYLVLQPLSWSAIDRLQSEQILTESFIAGEDFEVKPPPISSSRLEKNIPLYVLISILTILLMYPVLKRIVSKGGFLSRRVFNRAKKRIGLGILLASLGHSLLLLTMYWIHTSLESAQQHGNAHIFVFPLFVVIVLYAFAVIWTEIVINSELTRAR